MELKSKSCFPGSYKIEQIREDLCHIQVLGLPYLHILLRHCRRQTSTQVLVREVAGRVWRNRIGRVASGRPELVSYILEARRI